MFCFLLLITPLEIVTHASKFGLDSFGEHLNRSSGWAGGPAELGGAEVSQSHPILAPLLQQIGQVIVEENFTT